jgi:hypothetical protein
MTRSVRILIVALLVAVIAVSGCRREAVSFVDLNAYYTTQQLQQTLGRTSTGDVASKARQDASRLRHQVLTQLRAQGTRASLAADLITRTFPTATPSVPVYVERATVDGVDALVIVEAWGGPGGRLSSKRLWALDANSGTILFSASVGSGG